MQRVVASDGPLGQEYSPLCWGTTNISLLRLHRMGSTNVPLGVLVSVALGQSNTSDRLARASRRGARTVEISTPSLYSLRVLAFGYEGRIKLVGCLYKPSKLLRLVATLLWI